MHNVFALTLRFLQPVSHGRGENAEPEWPPSPLRAYQALVAAAAARWNEREQLITAAPALKWLENQSPPIIVAVNGRPSDSPFRMFVPNNTGDIPAQSWARGNEPNSTVKRVEKDIRVTHLAGDSVHYLYVLPDGDTECRQHLDTLREAARSITHVGWGVDVVVADAEIITQEQAEKLTGHRWRPVDAGGNRLRVHCRGTLDDLIRKHTEFLGRLTDDGFRPVRPIACFDVVKYHSPTVEGLPEAVRPMVAFEIHRTIDEQESSPAGKSKFRPFHPVRQVATVAGMFRHAAAKVAREMGMPDSQVVEQIEGHGGGRGGQATTRSRFQFLPLPSLTPVGVSGIRRVIMVGPPGSNMAPFRQRLNGVELIDARTERAVAMLSYIPTTDKQLSPFIGPATTWTTVTPVILPGYDDPAKLRRKLKAGVSAEVQKQLLSRLHDRVLELIWKAFGHAGWTSDALAGVEVEYRNVGFLQGLELANCYELPPHDAPRYHLRVRFPRPVRGPLAIGGGRHRGLGLFARCDNEFQA